MTGRPFGGFAALMATLLAGVLGVAASAAPAAAVSTDQSYWVPVDKQVTVRGHGYGHGHGMSQYGAQGAALEGQGYRHIVDFYYPGTSWSTVQGKVRVLITADTTADVVVGPVAGLSVRDRGDGTTYPLPEIPDLRRWRLNVDTEGNAVLGYLTKRWHRWNPPGRTALVGDGEFHAARPMTLWLPSGTRTYRGILRAASPSKGSHDRDTVNVVSMDQYVKGVVPYEMPASWHPEAVKAQAVAARTYGSWSREQARSRYYQICDTTSCQVYGGVAGEDPRSNAAVDATARQILTYRGEPAFTQFSSSSGGWTSAGSVPYLPAKRDVFDGWDGNYVHDWSVNIDASRIEQAYQGLGVLRRIRVRSRDGHGDWGGRIYSLVLDGTRGNVTVSGDSLRWMFGLRSNWFTIDPTPIISRWTRLGGSQSKLGVVRSGEYPVEDGSAQAFRSGRIFYSPATGARELYGPVLVKYRAIGGPGSALGLPTTAVQGRRNGFRAKFRNGVIYSHPRTGTVAVVGAIAERYRAMGGVWSRLGWPVASNVATDAGERATFEHGSITWAKKTGRTVVRITH